MASDLVAAEDRLWAAADQLWANTGLKPSEFSTPVLGLIFLRYADKRFGELQAKFKKKKVAPDELEPMDYQAEGVLYPDTLGKSKPRAVQSNPRWPRTAGRP